MKQKAIAILAITGLATVGWAQDTTNQPRNAAEAENPQATENEKARGSTEEMKEDYVTYRGIVDSTELEGSSVYNKQEEEIGNIDRLILDSDGQVEFAVVSVGGFLGIGDHLVGVPWSTMEIKEETDKSRRTATTAANQPDAEERPTAEAERTESTQADIASRTADESDTGEAPTLRVYLDADKDRLSEAPEFDPDNPNQLESTEATESFSAYWQEDRQGETVAETRQDAKREKTMDREKAGTKASKDRMKHLEVASVYNKQEEELGNVDRLLLDDDGRLEYVVVSVGGFLDVGDRLIAVPWSSFDIKKETPESGQTASTTAGNADAERAESSQAEVAERSEATSDAGEASILRLYLDADKDRLNDAPEFDPDTPIGSTDVASYWKKEESSRERTTGQATGRESETTTRETTGTAGN